MRAVISAASAQVLSHVQRNPSLLFFEIHGHRKATQLLADAVAPLISRFGTKDVLFEMPPEVKPSGVRKFLEADDVGTYERVCESTDVFERVLEIANKKYKAGLDVDELTRKNFARCMEIITLDDCVEVSKKVLGPEMPREGVFDFASILYGIGSCEKKILLSERAIKAVGEEHCHHVDRAIPGVMPNSDEAMATRNRSIADAVLRIPGAMGFFGLGHYRDDEKTGVMDLVCAKRPAVSPRDFLCIFPYSGEPMTEGDKRYRKDEGLKTAPIYAVDVSKYSVADLVERVAEIMQAHQKRFAIADQSLVR